MKTYLILASVSICLVFAACKKTELQRYCYDSVTGMPSEQLISQSNYETFKTLMAQNGLDYNNFLCHDFSPYYTEGRYVASANQYVNGLQVFNGDVSITFVSDTIFHISGHLISAVNLDTEPAMKVDDVIKLYRKELKTDYILLEINGHNLPYCYRVEFGYYNYYDTGNYCKAWKICPINTNYPVAFINDETSEIIFYWNGIFID